MMPASESTRLLQMRGVSKRFPGVVALDAVDFDVRAGEVHVLLGENGAGKSTLMKILSGAYRKDAGEVAIDGRHVAIDSPRAAMALGIATIYQELSLVPQLSVAENILLGHEPARAGWIDRRRLRDAARCSLEEVGIDLDPARRIDRLGLAEQQMVELAKALFRRARILVMDEPTSALTAREIDRLFDVVRRVTANGAGVVYISTGLQYCATAATRERSGSTRCRSIGSCVSWPIATCAITFRGGVARWARNCSAWSVCPPRRRSAT